MANETTISQFMQRYGDEYAALRYSLHILYESGKLFKLEGTALRALLEAGMAAAMRDYDCFDSDWLEALSDEQIENMTFEDVLEYAMQWGYQLVVTN